MGPRYVKSRGPRWGGGAADPTNTTNGISNHARDGEGGGHPLPQAKLPLASIHLSGSPHGGGGRLLGSCML